VVGHRGHATFDHFHQAEQHPPVDILLDQVVLQWPHKLVEPTFDRDIFGQTTEDDHRHVAVGVDQAGHGQHLPAFEQFVNLPHIGLAAWQNVHNFACVNDQVAVTPNVGGGSQNVAIADN
jgi:hypothetical protein